MEQLLKSVNVCILICTCDRHEMLGTLLAHFAKATYANSVPIYIADNGEKPANRVLERFSDRLTIHYTRVQETGLVPVRNAVFEMAMAGGHEFLALIDDDELPSPGWLEAHVSTALREKADVVTGPCLPLLDGPLPRWLRDTDFLDKDETTFGTHNVLLRGSALPDQDGGLFHPRFSRIGGEDWDLQNRLRSSGARFASSTEALVYEHVPPERRRLRYYFREGIRTAVMAAEIARHLDEHEGKVRLKMTRIGLLKLCYAAEHLLFCLFANGHLVRATKDLGYCWGTILTLLKVQTSFYGRT
ncbi:hypothetical protein NBRC116590_24100 [Pelagimonas sp. KU-00592-HH]|uniref:glycosyltransferase family 2 protein n=1 Tax=Pelagimonas sp. KU-00592-HH TaxID=3127651 RepID=UPI003108CB84